MSNPALSELLHAQAWEYDETTLQGQTLLDSKQGAVGFQPKDTQTPRRDRRLTDKHDPDFVPGSDQGFDSEDLMEDYDSNDEISLDDAGNDLGGGNNGLFAPQQLHKRLQQDQF